MSRKNTIIISTIIATIGTIFILIFFNPLEDNNQDSIPMNKEEQQKTIREPAVAGAFYPNNNSKLSEMVKGFLAQAPTSETEKEVVGLLAPHAGYPFSGPIAGSAYKTIKNKEYDTIVIIGSSHSRMFKGASVFKEGAYATPMGDIEIDEEITANLLKNEAIDHISEAHTEEHSIEVQLPFLSATLKNGYRIVPILIGGGEAENIVEPVSSALKNAIEEEPNKRVLLVASSDLSHYPAYEDAEMADQKVLEAIKTGSITELRSTIEALESQGIENAATFACAQRAIEIVMETSKELGASKFKVLDYANAGDATGDKSKVVGYGAAAFTKEVEDEETFTQKEKASGELKLNEEQKQILLSLARNTVETKIKGGYAPTTEKETPVLDKHLGVFVTIKKNGALRGCMGIFEPDIPLRQVIPKVATSAAISDPRFPPVTKEELPEIEYEISILSPLKKLNDPNQIELGVHGVKIEKEGHSGVFLPKVAKETGWDINTFMNEICTQKMDLERECWKKPDAKIYTFKTTEFSE